MDSEALAENSSSRSVRLTISSVEKGGARGEKVKVVLSDGFSFFIFRNALLQEGIYCGDEITDETVDSLQRKSLFIEAEKKALRYLGRSPHTRRALKLKLLKKGLAEELVEQVLKRCVERGYIDDRTFAEEWLRIRLLRHPEGRPALMAGLVSRGVPASLAEEVVGLNFNTEVEGECARRFTAKLLRHGDLLPNQLAQKLSARKFSYRVVREMMNELGGES